MSETLHLVTNTGIRLTALVLFISYRSFVFIISDINHCANEPCQNEGTCTDHVIGHTCDCVAGYTGTNCETGRLICSNILVHLLYERDSFGLGPNVVGVERQSEI